jgi:hypothetical protein
MLIYVKISDAKILPLNYLFTIPSRFKYKVSSVGLDSVEHRKVYRQRGLWRIDNKINLLKRF